MNGSSSEKRALFDPPINDNTLNNKDDQEPLHKSPKRRIEEEGDEEEKVSISEVFNNSLLSKIHLRRSFGLKKRLYGDSFKTRRARLPITRKPLNEYNATMTISKG